MWQIGHAQPLVVAIGLPFLISSDQSVIADLSFASSVLWWKYGE